MTPALRPLIVVAALAACSHAAAVSVVNGDFEATPLGSGWTLTPTTAVAAVAAYAGCCAGPGVYPGGSNAAFFGWGNQEGGSISQYISTVIGQQYVVTFGYGAIAASLPQQLRAAVDNTGVSNLVVSATGTFDRSAILSAYSLSFVANATTTRLSFTDISTVTNNVDGVLDDVSVTAVPEPGSYAMMLAGLAMVGAVARRRRGR